VIDEKTNDRNYPLPHHDNILEEDVSRIRDSFENIDIDIKNLLQTTAELSTKSEETQSGNTWYALSTGVENAYQMSLDPTLTAINSGFFAHMKAHIGNTGPATLDINSIGTKTIKKTDGSDLKAGDILPGAACFLFYDGTNFQLINPKVDQEQTETNTSNIMRAFEEIQESHGGSLFMEAGWSDSFGNANEQGADEANSVGYEYDSPNTLYKGTEPGIGLNSDKDYDSGTNYLEQEWTKTTGAGTSQATVASGTTVTLSSGIWPINCVNGRISFDGGITFFNITSRNSDTELTLDATATDGTFDYSIRLTAFMTIAITNLCLGQTYHASSENGGNVKGNAFNGNTGDQWYGTSTDTGWIACQFSAPRTITKIRIHNGENHSTNKIKDWTLYGSNSAAGTGGTIITTGQHPNQSSVWAEYAFSNSTAFTYYTLKIENQWVGGYYTLIGELEMMEDASGPQLRLNNNVINEHASICDAENLKTDSSSWSDIISASITETLNLQSAYYWLVFDPASGLGNGTEIKIFNAAGNAWRKIVKNNGGTWEYNNNSANDAVETWISYPNYDMLHTISKAVELQSANRMTGANLSAITDTQWEETGGWSTSVDSIVRGITLYSNNSAQTPSVSKYRLNYNSERGAMDLKSKAYDPGFIPSEVYLWTRAEHSDVDGSGTFSVSRNGGSEWETISMVQQGLPFGNVRVLRGTVGLSGQTSGQDLRCRYQTTQSKEQFLHSWGLQAKG
jgi:hypothetical protein